VLHPAQQTIDHAVQGLKDMGDPQHLFLPAANLIVADPCWGERSILRTSSIYNAMDKRHFQRNRMTLEMNLTSYFCEICPSQVAPARTLPQTCIHVI
jgi:hypothetical protein